MTGTTQLPDDDTTKAVVEMVGRTGATNLEVGWLEGHPAETCWWAQAQYTGTRIMVEGHPDPGAALQALAVRLLHGGRCIGCRKLIAMSDDPVPMPAQMLEGGEVDPDRERARGLCRWKRDGAHWVAGCGERQPEHTARERLAQALAEVDAPSDMIATARSGRRWDDYLSEYPFPTILLVEDLQANGMDELAERVKAGEFDAGREESEAWARSEDGQAAFAELVKPRQPWRSKRSGKKHTR